MKKEMKHEVIYLEALKWWGVELPDGSQYRQPSDEEAIRAGIEDCSYNTVNAGMVRYYYGFTSSDLLRRADAKCRI